MTGSVLMLAGTLFVVDRDEESSSQHVLMLVLLAASALLALASIIGWTIGVVELTALLPWLPTMKVNTSVCFLALVVGIAMTSWLPSAGRVGRLALALALVIAGLSLAQSAFGVDFGIDQWLARDTVTTGAHAPGRPAAATAAAIVALAVAALMPANSRWRPLPVLIACLIGYTVTIGLVLEVPWGGSLGQAFATVSIPTAACIVMLSCVLLSGTSVRGTVLARLAAGTAGARLLRAAIPLAMLAPAAVMWLQHMVSRLGWWGARGGLAIATTASAVLFIAIAAIGARWIDRLQDELRAANEQLEARVAQRTQELLTAQAAHVAVTAAHQVRAEFLSRVSHELRTPLNAILGFTQLLQLDPDRRLDPAQRGYLGHLATAGQQLSMLVGDLLDFGRADAGRVAMTTRAEDAFALAQQAVRLIGPESHAAGIAVELDPADGNTGVEVDGARMLQVLANLLSNAVKYNRAGGSVRVRVQRDGGDVVIAVADTGDGIEASRLDQLFVPFNRLGREVGPVPGTGLGLVLARRLVEQMHGRIEVSSAPGVGSVFSVRLPALPQH